MSYVSEGPKIILAFLEYPFHLWGAPAVRRWFRQLCGALGAPPPRPTKMSEQVLEDWEYLAYVMDSSFGILPESLFEDHTRDELLDILNQLRRRRHKYSDEFVDYLFDRKLEYDLQAERSIVNEVASLKERIRSKGKKVDCRECGASNLRAARFCSSCGIGECALLQAGRRAA